ncbi:DUF1684 domain-containing protein [Haliscomenobacter sp.]|uniref:DUF1684 domain-containing protein n=1 Tax=Haliscomenobacter sp. TaxID=2717303 RepID=UPI003364EEE5
MKKITWILFLCLSSQSLQAQTSTVYLEKIAAHRKSYLRAFLQNPASPLSKKELKKVAFFAPDEAFLLASTFTPTLDATPFEMPTYSGESKTYVQYGIAKFTLSGQEYKLNIYRMSGRILPQYRDLLFVPFKDQSNGESTYGGGRYLDLRVQDIVDNTLVLDFNKAYNPYCAYSDGYSCPIPPDENHLEVRILAGEKEYFGKKKDH